MMMISRRLLLIVANVFAIACSSTKTTVNAQDEYGQDYGQGGQEYSQDGLYADYARQQQAKEVAGKA